MISGKNTSMLNLATTKKEIKIIPNTNTKFSSLKSRQKLLAALPVELREAQKQEANKSTAKKVSTSHRNQASMKRKSDPVFQIPASSGT